MWIFMNFYSTYVRRKEKKWMEARQSSRTYQGIVLIIVLLIYFEVK